MYKRQKQNRTHTIKTDTQTTKQIRSTWCLQTKLLRLQKIGQTGRSFKQRYIEHTKALHTTTESTFANHLIEAIHTYKNIDNNMDILHAVSYTHLDVYKRQAYSPKL